MFMLLHNMIFTVVVLGLRHLRYQHVVLSFDIVSVDLFFHVYVATQYYFCIFCVCVEPFEASTCA